MKRSGLILACLALTVSASAWSDDSDWSVQFDSKIEQQDPGTCHLFAAASLFGAACFRLTGTHVHVSEAVLYVQHLHEAWINQLLPFQKSNENIAATAPLLPNPVGYTGTDGGSAQEDLEMILHGTDCVSREEFPLNKELVDNVIHIAWKYGPAEAALLKNSSAAFGKSQASVRNLRVQAANELERTRDDYLTPISSSSDAEIIQENSNIAKCTQAHFQMTNYGAMGPAQVEVLLRKGPVFCSVNTGDGLHALVLAGHMLDHGIDKFLMINSDLNHTVPYWESRFWGCNQVLTLN